MGTKKFFCFIFILLGGILISPPVRAELQSQSLLGAPAGVKGSSGGSFKLGAQDAESSFAPSNVGIIGIKYLHKPGEMSTVIDIYPNTPAEAANVRVGDRILEVDGMNIIPLSSDQVFSVIAGRPGTMVTLKMMRCPNNYGSHLGCGTYTVDLKRMDMNQIASDKIFHIYKYGGMY